MKKRIKIFAFTMLLTKLHTIKSFLRITFNNVDGYIKKYDKTRYLALHHSENVIEYLIEIDMICFRGMVDRQKEFSFIFSRNHCQRSSPSPISDTQRAGFEPAQNLSLGYDKWDCAVVITTTRRRVWIEYIYCHNIKIKIDSEDDLPSEKKINIYNVVILFKSAFNENHNHLLLSSVFRKMFI